MSNLIHHPYISQDVLLIEEGGPEVVTPSLQVTERCWLFDPETFDVEEIPPPHDGFINAAFQKQGGIEIDELTIGPNDDDSGAVIRSFHSPGATRAGAPLAHSTPRGGTQSPPPPAVSPVGTSTHCGYDADLSLHRDFFGSQHPHMTQHSYPDSDPALKQSYDFFNELGEELAKNPNFGVWKLIKGEWPDRLTQRWNAVKYDMTSELKQIREYIKLHPDVSVDDIKFTDIGGVPVLVGPYKTRSSPQEQPDPVDKKFGEFVVQLKQELKSNPNFGYKQLLLGPWPDHLTQKWNTFKHYWNSEFDQIQDYRKEHPWHPGGPSDLAFVEGGGSPVLVGLDSKGPNMTRSSRPGNMTYGVGHGHGCMNDTFTAAPGGNKTFVISDKVEMMPGM